MKCPECKKGELKENISIRGFLKKKKIHTWFCPLCDFERIKKIPISLSDAINHYQKNVVDAQGVNGSRGHNVNVEVK